MALLIRKVLEGYKVLFTDLADPRMQQYPLLGSPIPMIIIVGLYIHLVTNVGPKWMENRPAFKLNRLIQVYDVMQVLLSFWIFIEAGFVYLVQYNWICQPVDYSDDPIALKMARCCYVYYVVKVIDLMDTVFFVLRKKNKQISFLHVYHHSTMVIGTFVFANYLPAGQITLLGVLNCLVHTVMYSYYFLTSIGPEYCNTIRWKKYITQMQMVQFGISGAHQAIPMFISNCDYPRWIGLFTVPQNTIMFFLFYDFYKKAYCKKQIVK